MKRTTLYFPIPYLIRRNLACQSTDSEEYADPKLEPHEKYLDDWANKHNVPDQTRYNLSAILQGLSTDRKVSEQWYNRDCVLWATVQTSDNGMFWSVSFEFVEGETMTPERLHEMLVNSPLPYTTDLDLVNGHLSMRVAGVIVRRKTKGWVVDGCHFPCIIPDSAPIWIVHAVIVEMISQSQENKQ